MAERIVSYRDTFINSSGTFLSRLTGILKQNVVNYLFGASQDPFILAFRLVNSFRRYIGEGALTSAFIPVYQKEMSEKKHKNKADLFASNVINIFLIITGFLTITGIILAPYYTPYLVPGYKKGSFELHSNILLTMIMMPYIIFIFLYAISMGILNCHKKFFTSAFSPLFFNIAFIVIPILFYKQLGIYSLGIAVLIGVIAMFLFQLFELIPLKFKYSFYLNPKDQSLKSFFSLFNPTAINMIVLTVKNLVTTLFLSLYIGSAMLYMNAMMIIEAPLGIVGIAIGTVIMPLLSRFNANRDEKNFQKTLVEGFYLFFYLMIPISVFFILFPDTIINSVFRDIMKIFTGNTGKFTPLLMKQNYIALSIYSLALIPMGCTVLFEKLFYSRHDAKTPLFANIVVFIISFSLYFSALIPSISFYGVFIADTIAAWMTLIYYLYFLNKASIKINYFKSKFLKKIVALILLSFVSAALILPFHIYVYLKNWHPFISFSLAGIELALFGGIYYILSRIFGLELKR